MAHKLWVLKSMFMNAFELYIPIQKFSAVQIDANERCIILHPDCHTDIWNFQIAYILK